jgi:hypothetical protein
MVVGGTWVLDVVDRVGEVVVAERVALHAATTTTSVRQTQISGSGVSKPLLTR